MNKILDTHSKDFLMTCSKEDFEYYTADEDYLHYYDEAGIPPSASHAFDHEQEIIEEQKELSYKEWLERNHPDIYREDQDNVARQQEEWNYTLNYYNYHHIDRDEPAWKIAVDNITKILN